MDGNQRIANYHVSRVSHHEINQSNEPHQIFAGLSLVDLLDEGQLAGLLEGPGTTSGGGARAGARGGVECAAFIFALSQSLNFRQF